jgi:CheY-like chemotaxis protein
MVAASALASELLHVADRSVDHGAPLANDHGRREARFVMVDSYVRGDDDALPRWRAAQSSTDSAREATFVSDRAAPRPRLLLVEDDPAVRRSLRRMLEDVYAVEEAGTLAEASAALQAWSFAAVLTDYQLPDGLGTAILEQSQRAIRGSRRVLMSGGDVPRIDELVRNGNVHAFLSKPFVVRDLMALLGPR